MRPDLDPFDLDRFVTAQAPVHADALAELQAGHKRSHWIWFVFPQADGLGSSSMARRYAIGSLDEARAYLAHPVLGTRLRTCCDALLALHGPLALQVFGSPDDMKLRSSMSLFHRADPAEARFKRVLERYFDAVEDPRTVAWLGAR